MTIPSQDLKKCTKCGEEKPASEYYMRSAGYANAECKACTKVRSQTHRHANLEKYREHDREYGKWKRDVIKNAVFEKYGGFKCVCCGETEKLFLTLDHINNDGAADRRKIAGRQTAAGYVTYRYLFRNNFPSGYQVMCANCQHGKRMNKGVCPHQVRCNDYPLIGVEPSGSKFSAPHVGDDIVCSASKDAVVLRGRFRK